MNELIKVVRQEGESDLEFIWRVCSMKDAGTLDCTWEEVALILNTGDAGGGEWLGESAYRKKYQQAKAFYEEVFAKMGNTDYTDDIQDKTRELHKARYKLQTEKIEYNKWLRTDARNELFEEKVINAIRDNVCASPLPEITPIDAVVDDSEPQKDAILCIADCHFGKQFCVHGLNGDIVNEYSPEIFQRRMSQVLNETIKYLKDRGITSLKIYNLGDSVDGFLRHSQLWTLRYGVIDSAIIFADFIGSCLITLSEHVYVEYFQTDGNHEELRLLDGQKGQHKNESIGKVIRHIIQLKNEGNPNFTMKSNNSGLIFDTVCGYKVLGIHGEVKDIKKSVQDYSNLYNEDISYVVYGHKHHTEFYNSGRRKGCIGVGSIVGTDEYAMSIMCAADPSATIVVFEEGKGKVDEHTIVLD